MQLRCVRTIAIAAAMFMLGGCGGNNGGSSGNDTVGAP